MWSLRSSGHLLLSALVLTLMQSVDGSSTATGVLPPCPASPNCVSTEATRESQRVPTVPFADDPASAQRRARGALEAESRVTITVDAPGHLHAECRSLVFRFVDDVDVVIDSTAKVFRFRSASRVGESDLGVNRRRVERIARRLRQTP